MSEKKEPLMHQDLGWRIAAVLFIAVFAFGALIAALAG
jgi:hypothetical protein